MTFQEAYAYARKELEKHPCENSNAEREASELVALSSGTTKEFCITAGNEKFPDSALSILETLLERRLRHEPMGYILGKSPFLDFELQVNEHTLIPRPATEAIMEELFSHDIRPDTVIDVGTGSGCMAISAARHWKNARVIATDISEPTLDLARKNADRLASDRIDFRHGNLLEPAIDAVADSVMPLIVTNPPYLPNLCKDSMEPDVHAFEPASALFSGDDGLDLYRQLFEQCSETFKNVTLRIACEMLPEQSASLETIVREHWPDLVAEQLRSGTATVGLLLTIET